MITIIPLREGRISTLIFSKFGPILSDREAEMVDYCQSIGEVYIASVGDEMLCCYGLVPPSFLATEAYLWMWSPRRLRHAYAIARQSKVQIARMLERFDCLVGHCKKESLTSQRWLRWLGAAFTGEDGALVTFEIRRA